MGVGLGGRVGGWGLVEGVGGIAVSDGFDVGLGMIVQPHYLMNY